MAFSNDNVLICVCLLFLFVPSYGSIAIRRVQTNAGFLSAKLLCNVENAKFLLSEKQGTFSDVEITLNCNNETLGRADYGVVNIINREHHSWMCYYIILPLELIFCTVFLFKICYKARKNKWFFKILRCPGFNINSHSQRREPDVESGITNTSQVNTEYSNDEHSETLTVTVDSNPTESFTLPDICPLVLLEGDNLFKRAYTTTEDDEEELWYPDHEHIFQPIQQDPNDTANCEGACNFECSANSDNVNNSIYKQLEDIMVLVDSFGYDEEMDNMDNVDDDFGLQNLGLQYY